MKEKYEEVKKVLEDKELEMTMTLKELKQKVPKDIKVRRTIC